MKAWFRDLQWLDRIDWGFTALFLFLDLFMFVMFFAVVMSGPQYWVLSLLPLVGGLAILYSLKKAIDESVLTNKDIHRREQETERWMRDYDF